MGDLSLFASKFNTSSLSLKDYDDALRFLKKRERDDNSDRKTKIQKILKVVNPVSEVIQGKLSNSVEIDENSVLNILMHKHEKDWFSYKDKIVTLNGKLLKGEFELSFQDIDLLNDIGDAQIGRAHV